MDASSKGIKEDPSTTYKTVPAEISLSIPNKMDFISKRGLEVIPILSNFQGAWNIMKRKNVIRQTLIHSSGLALELISRNGWGNRLVFIHTAEVSLTKSFSHQGSLDRHWCLLRFYAFHRHMLAVLCQHLPLWNGLHFAPGAQNICNVNVTARILLWKKIIFIDRLVLSYVSFRWVSHITTRVLTGC